MMTASSARALLRLDHVAFSYPQQPEALFEEVSVQLHPGWYGLVGANGVGKSTLLALMAGALSPERGEVWWAQRPHLCEQEVGRVEPVRELVSERWEAHAMKLRSVLALDEEALWRWESCSCGERKRWQLGAALMSGSALLLFDEPTNHLDQEGRARLIEAMHLHEGVGVLVSHDRALLDEVTSQTLWLEQGGLTLYAGGYSAAIALRDEARARMRQEREAMVTRRAAMRADQERLQRARHGAERNTLASHRMKNPNDNDGRSMLAKGRAEQAERSLAARVGTTRDAIARLDARIEQAPILAERAHELRLPHRTSPREIVAHLGLEGGLYAGDRLLIEEVGLTLHRHDRIWLCGPNGSGKSTLMRALWEAMDVASREHGVLYIAQEVSEGGRAALMAQLQACSAAARGEWLGWAAHLGVDVARLLEDGVPSPGTARKLELARGLGEGVWCVMLDEPTNHLDLGAIEALERALQAYGGALVVITHDEPLARATCDTAWQIDPARARLDRVPLTDG